MSASAPASPCEPRAFLQDHLHLIEKPRIDPRDLVQPLHRHAPVERGGDHEDPLGGRDRRPAHQLLGLDARKRRADGAEAREIGSQTGVPRLE